MKLLILVMLATNFLSAQVGINTTSPTEDLDVNGGLRVRNLSNGLVVANNTGVLSVSNLIKSVAGHNNWNGVLVGSKSSILFFAGRASVLGTDLAFIVHYDANAGSFSVVSNTNCTVTNLGMSEGNNGRLRVNLHGVNYVLTFVSASGLSTITNTNTTTNWFQGTFFSITHSI